MLRHGHRVPKRILVHEQTDTSLAPWSQPQNYENINLLFMSMNLPVLSFYVKGSDNG